MTLIHSIALRTFTTAARVVITVFCLMFGVWFACATWWYGSKFILEWVNTRYPPAGAIEMPSNQVMLCAGLALLVLPVAVVDGVWLGAGIGYCLLWPRKALAFAMPRQALEV
jgi:hypothetical protein